MHLVTHCVGTMIWFAFPNPPTPKVLSWTSSNNTLSLSWWYIYVELLLDRLARRPNGKEMLGTIIPDMLSVPSLTRQGIPRKGSKLMPTSSRTRRSLVPRRKGSRVISTVQKKGGIPALAVRFWWVTTPVVPVVLVYWRLVPSPTPYV